MFSYVFISRYFHQNFNLKVSCSTPITDHSRSHTSKYMIFMIIYLERITCYKKWIYFFLLNNIITQYKFSIYKFSLAKPKCPTLDKNIHIPFEWIGKTVQIIKFHVHKILNHYDFIDLHLHPFFIFLISFILPNFLLIFLKMIQLRWKINWPLPLYNYK
jgi:hypothetical protein